MKTYRLTAIYCNAEQIRIEHEANAIDVSVVAFFGIPQISRSCFALSLFLFLLHTRYLVRLLPIKWFWSTKRLIYGLC